jgi:SAM-dependent methyltransferase
MARHPIPTKDRQTWPARLRAYAEKDGRGYPDWAARYAPIVRRLGAHGKHGRTLEIGANANGIARFTGQRVVAVDIATAHLREARAAQPILPAVADLRSLPLGPGAFQRIVCVDVFEHIDEAMRAAAIREIRRCLANRGALVLAFPTGRAAHKAEARVRRAYTRHTGETLRWLEEHTQMGLPNADAVGAELAKVFGATHRISRHGNVNVYVWTWMWRVLMAGWPGRGNSIFQVLLRWLTPAIARFHVPPCYRVIFFVEPREDTAAS